MSAASISLACWENAQNQNGGGGNRKGPSNQNGANTAQAVDIPQTPSPAPEPADEKVRKLVADLGTALARGDADALEQIYSDGYVHISDNGRLFTKADLLVGVRSGTVKFGSVNLEDVSVRAYDNTAIAIATFVGTSNAGGRQINISDRATMVAERENDQWRLVSSQMTAIQTVPMTGNSRPLSTGNQSGRDDGTGTGGGSSAPGRSSEGSPSGAGSTGGSPGSGGR
jgi:ketosteroid isomerase-like protein